MSRAKRRSEAVAGWESLVNVIHDGDCIELLEQIPDGAIDMSFCDPPFNVGEDYDEYNDHKTPAEYLEWSESWLKEVHRTLTPAGTFWLAIDSGWVSELDVLAKEIGFHQRKHCLWYFCFGVNQKENFTTSHTHLLYYTKHPRKFTFNEDQVRVPSARQLAGDKRANPDGRLPDSTWILRPTDPRAGFGEDSSVQAVPRIAGTHAQRAGTPNQMPEVLLGRILRLCSNPGDLVLDPFGGSFTTVAVAKKLGRRYISCDLSSAYCLQGRIRVDSAKEGDMLDGDRPWADGGRPAPRVGRRKD